MRSVHVKVALRTNMLPPINRRSQGFSLVELIVVILLLGIMAVFVAPRLQRTQINELGFFQDALAAIRYAHKVAITSGCEVRVDVTPGSMSLSYAGNPVACGTGGVIDPSSNSPFTVTAPGSASITGVSFVFDMIGDPSIAQDLIVTNADASTRTIRVVDDTGFSFSL